MTGPFVIHSPYGFLSPACRIASVNHMASSCLPVSSPLSSLDKSLGSLLELSPGPHLLRESLCNYFSSWRLFNARDDLSTIELYCAILQFVFPSDTYFCLVSFSLAFLCFMIALSVCFKAKLFKAKLSQF